MKIEEALKAMRAGKKMRSPSNVKGDYLFALSDGYIRDENSDIYSLYIEDLDEEWEEYREPSQFVDNSFTWMLDAIHQGYCVRRRHWHPDLYIFRGLISEHVLTNYEMPYGFSLDDILATDWEIKERKNA